MGRGGRHESGEGNLNENSRRQFISVMKNGEKESETSHWIEQSFKTDVLRANGAGRATRLGRGEPKRKLEKAIYQRNEE